MDSKAYETMLIDRLFGINPGSVPKDLERVMRAAPALLEALEYITATASAYELDINARSVSDAITGARAAIAQARGEKS